MSKYQSVINKLRVNGAYTKENYIGQLIVDEVKTHKEFDADCLVLQEAIDKANKYDHLVEEVKKDIENVKVHTSDLEDNELRKFGVEILEIVLKYAGVEGSEEE